MPYCTKTQLIDQFGETELRQLTDRDKTGSIDDNVLNNAIDAAAREIDGYLRSRYALPLSQAQIDESALPEKAGDIVRHFLYGKKVPEEVLNRYKAAVAWLLSASRPSQFGGIGHQRDRSGPGNGAGRAKQF